jgi:hypothetical protein
MLFKLIYLNYTYRGKRHNDPKTTAPGKEIRHPLVQEAWWAQGPVWTDEENLARNRIQSQDRAARSESLYQLSYPQCSSRFSFTV